jgi:hypothetical protein
MSFKNFMLKLLLGNSKANIYKPSSFYKKQKQNLLNIWNNKTYNDFGIERILRLILQTIAYVTPAGVVRYLTGTDNLIIRKLGIEIYAIFKLVLICFAFGLDLTENTFVLITIIILTLDTIHFLIARVFLNDVFREAISHRRSLIMTIINYVEICLCFAFIYSYLDDTNHQLENPTFHISSDLPQIEKGHLNDNQTIYFSFITAATIGYGDISPRDSLTMKIVIIQTLISLFFIVVFISNIINKLNEDTFYNRKKEKK